MEYLAAGIKSQVESVGNTDLMSPITSIVNAVFIVVGILAVIVIIIGGFFYMTSQGDPGKAAKGKNCIMGGIIGLIVCLLAFAIVAFVTSSL